MLATDYIFNRASISRLRLHQLNEVVSDLVPLPVNHDVEDASEGDRLRSQDDTLVHMQADVAV